MDTPIVTPWFLDKALWLVVLAPLFAILATKFGIVLNAAEIVGLVLPVVTYIITHKWKTTILQKALIENAANSDPTPDEAAKVVAGVK